MRKNSANGVLASHRGSTLDGHFAHLAGYSSAMPLDVDHLSVRMPTEFSHSLL